MLKVKDLQVKVTYRVGLGNVEMPENVFDQIQQASESGNEIETGSMEYQDAAEWLTNNIKEGDCMDWSAEIQELS